MRVFFALTFYDNSKEEISQYRDFIANNSVKGKFIDTRNIHLTLEFLGEIRPNELDKLKTILSKLNATEISLLGSYYDSFRKKNKDIIWIGIEKNKTLINLVKQLRTLLTQEGYETENNTYIPHITLGRQIVISEQFRDFTLNPVKIPVRSIAIMESKRVHDKLVYEPISEILI